MKFSRCIVSILVLLFISQASAFAGAPAPTTERPIPVERVSAPPTPPSAPAADSVNPLVISKHFTCGIGFGGSPLIGFVEKDPYGYPRTEYGLISGIGFGMTWFKGYPSADAINAAVAIVKANNPGVSDKDLPSLVRKQLGITSLSYVGLGILNAEMGTEWIVSDSMRTRFGFGLPFLVSFGVNFDF
ncbi:MAG: hypothetical protein ABH860_00125 [bacterium]